MSGMKMNFHKSEVILMGGEEGEHARVANIINCQEGAFPFKYLGFTIADRKLTITDLEPVVAKVGFYTEPWQGKFMSSTARLTLVDACLSSLPLHTMVLFLLPKGIHAGLDKHKGCFFWEEKGNKHKYHMVSRADICKPRNQIGLGVSSTRWLNTVLMAKCVSFLKKRRKASGLDCCALKIRVRWIFLAQIRLVGVSSGTPSTR